MSDKKPGFFTDNIGYLFILVAAIIALALLVGGFQIIRYLYPHGDF